MKAFPTLLLTLLCLGCKSPSDPSPSIPDPVTPGGNGETRLTATAYTTTVGGKEFSESEITLGKPEDVNFYKVTLDGESYQTVDGFGFAITQASGSNLLLMPPSDRKAFLEELFSREKGHGSSLIRVCIGGSDFSLDEFTCCDTPGIEHFAMHPLDEEYVFPILDEILKINPGVKIIASPWSCPRWMKVSDSGGSYDAWTGGRLNPKYYQDYATYFVKWIQEMEKRGYPVMGVTLQNEPLNRGNSMSLYMSWEEQRDFIKTAVGPAFAAAGLKTKILVFDHNYNYDDIASEKDYPLKIYADDEASKYIAGSAWHNYGGNVATLDRVHSQYPDKEIYFTEASIGTWNYNDFGVQLLNDFRDIFLGTLGRFGKGVTLWNLMLDDEHKPYRPGGCGTCWGGVTISSKDHSIKRLTRNSQYYNVAHCSRVLQPGAVRLGTSGYTTAGLTYQWYRNPDGSYAALLLNEGTSQVQVNLVSGKASVACKVPARSIQSVLWKEE